MERNADAPDDNLESDQRLRHQAVVPIEQPNKYYSKLFPFRRIEGFSEFQLRKKPAQPQEPPSLNKRKKRPQQRVKMQGDQQCQVCLNFYNKKQTNQFGVCGHKCCQPCLTQHINYSINNFKAVTCLHEDCKQSLDITSPHIRSLALPLQEKYYKIIVQLNLSKQDNIRICPTENCEGYIQMLEERMQCPICKITFCKLCLLPKHKGNCDQNGAKFFEDNYLFKKCSKCRMVLEKKEGCNHMTCKCGYQFCYRCGEKWISDHVCILKEKANQRQLSNQLPQALHPLPQPLPALVLPQFSSDMIRNNYSQQLKTETKYHQERAQPQLDDNVASRPNDNQHPNHNKCFSCFISTLKMVLLVAIHIISCQLVITIFFCICMPIILTTAFFIYSFGAGMKQMIQQSSCLHIALMNIFLYLYHVVLFFCKNYPEHIKDCYCRYFAALDVLFPLTSMVHQECLK